MATFSVDGIISGLDTAGIIGQLMQIEAQPQTRLKMSVSSAQSAVSAYQSINTRLAALGSAAATLQKATTWTATSASANSDAVSVSAGDGALASSLTFSVDALATSRSIVSQTVTSRTDPATVTGWPIEIRDTDGTLRTTVTPADGSLDAIAAAINSDSEAKVQAAVVQVSDGAYRLQLTSTATGTAGDFLVSGQNNVPLQGLSFTDVTAAQDAKLHVGPATGGYDVTSSSNTVDGLMPGVTVKLTKPATDVTVTVTPNQSAAVDAVQALVTAANSALSELARQGSVGTANPDGSRSGQGPLAGTALLRDLSNRIVSAVTSAVGSASAGGFGLSITRDGTFTLDKGALQAALTKDPSAVQAVFAPQATGSVGVASRITDVTTAATTKGTGLVTLAIDGQTRLIRDLTGRISDWDGRLAQKREALQRTYSSLEVSLSQLKSQSSWLAGQLSGLSSSAGG